jgi:hypothetical protein
MHIFIDEFITKIAEYYGGRPGNGDERQSEEAELEMMA